MEIYGSLITKNEEEWVGVALSGMSWMKKIVLVDNGSTDRTLEIAKEFPNVLIKNVSIDLPHCVAAQRNVSINYIPKNSWIYFCDADEYITKDLESEIRDVMSVVNGPTAFQIPRKNIFLGKYLRHGGWYPDYQIRLIKRESLISWVNGPLDLPQIIHNDKYSYLKKAKYGPHDKPLLRKNTLVGQLKSPYIHYNHRSIDDMLKKTPRFLNSELEYLQNSSKLNKPSYTKIIFSPLVVFIKRFFLKKGFLDGYVGLIESLYMSFSSFIFEAKKWEKFEDLDPKYKKYKSASLRQKK